MTDTTFKTPPSEEVTHRISKENLSYECVFFAEPDDEDGYFTALEMDFTETPCPSEWNLTDLESSESRDIIIVSSVSSLEGPDSDCRFCYKQKIQDISCSKPDNQNS